MKIKCKDTKTKSKKVKQIIGLHYPLLKKCKRIKKTQSSLLRGSRKRNLILESISEQRDSAIIGLHGNSVTNNISRPRSENVSANISVVQMSSSCKNNFISLNLGLPHDDEEIKPNCIPLTSLLPTACKTSSSLTNISGQNNINSINVNQVKHVNDKFNVIECDLQKNVTDKTWKTVKKCSITVRTSDHQITTAVIYELNRSKCLVILKPENYFYFVGIVELQLVQGSAEILGYNLHESKTKLLVFSPLGSSHLYIKATMNECSFNSARCKQLELLGLPQKTQRDILKDGENCSIFILSRKKAHVSNSVWPLLFENHLSFSIFPPSSLKELETGNRPCHVIECRTKFGETQEKIPEHGKEIVELLEWQNIIEGISHQDSPKVVICGGKSVGKSTFLRYLINKSLKKWNRVLVIDFDPGQCEFTTAGCVSVSLVEEPVLGPNFTHLREPVRSIFLGEVDVKKCPEDYIEGCKTLIKYADSNYDSTPWLINTMGFSRGFGVTLICGIIQNVRPTNVIQIMSKHSKFNFPSQLEPGFVYNQDVGSFGPSNGLNMYNFHLLPCAPEQQSSTSHRQRDINPQEARRLVTLSYLSNMMESKTSLTQVTPYMINMDLLNLRTTNKSNLSKTEIAAAMNGNLVALCSQSEDDAFPNCHGFGIVRGIDMEAGLLFLITPVPNQTLRKVSCLIKGSVALPDSLYYNRGDQVKGHIPYMAHTSGGSTALFAKRDYRTLPVTKPSR